MYAAWNLQIKIHSKLSDKIHSELSDKWLTRELSLHQYSFPLKFIIQFTEVYVSISPNKTIDFISFNITVHQMMR